MSANQHHLTVAPSLRRVDSTFRARAGDDDEISRAQISRLFFVGFFAHAAAYRPGVISATATEKKTAVFRTKLTDIRPALSKFSEYCTRSYRRIHNFKMEADYRCRWIREFSKGGRAI